MMLLNCKPRLKHQSPNLFMASHILSKYVEKLKIMICQTE